MLGLQCERGDIAIREDLGKTFILTQMPPSVLSNWRELTSTNVTSVNGQTGAITGLAKSGVNNDITGLNALSGPLRLGGDAAGDYDAVTLKQLRAASGGAGGASMNGVMNNFIGAVEWFNGSRAKLPAGYIPADGQLVSRTDAATFDLWAAVNSGMLVSTTTDALWMNTGSTINPYANRGKYSPGDGSTNFRVPDLNGMVANSIGAVFLRGNNGDGVSFGLVGTIMPNRSPNIKGTIQQRGADSVGTGSILQSAAGALQIAYNNGAASGKTQPLPAGSMSTDTITFDASKSSPAYGRLGADGAQPTGEVAPNFATGIWIIRASGLFAAQGTAFTVSTGDATLPPANTQLSGGELRTEHMTAGVVDVRGFMRADRIVGGKKYLRLGILSGTSTDAEAGPYNSIDIMEDGSIACRASATIANTLTVGSGAGIAGLPTSGSINSSQVQSGQYILRDNSYTNVGQGRIACYATSSLDYRFEIYASEVATTNRRSNILTVDITDLTKGSTASGGGTNSTTNIVMAGNFRASGTVTGNGAYINSSDRRAKDNLERVTGALKAVYGWGGYTYDLKDVGREVGLLAQDVEKDCPAAITSMRREFNDGEVIEDFKGLNTAGVSAAYHTEAIREIVGLIKSALTNPQAALAMIAELENTGK